MRRDGVSYRVDGLLAAIQSFGNLAASLWTVLSPNWAFAYLAAAMLIATTTLIATRTAA